MISVVTMAYASSDEKIKCYDGTDTKMEKECGAGIQMCKKVLDFSGK